MVKEMVERTHWYGEILLKEMHESVETDSTSSRYCCRVLRNPGSESFRGHLVDLLSL